MRKYVARNPGLTSQIMARVRSKNNLAEMRLRKALWRRGWRYRLYPGLPGKPDVFFPRAKLALFVDGDFWHGRLLLEQGPEALAATFRGKSQPYWIDKISRNVRRDIEVNHTLRAAGFRVVRVWERDVQQNLRAVVDRVERLLWEAAEVRQGGSAC